MSTLTISVLDTATIFEGPDTLFRYDLPGTGIVEGWATEAVVEQAEQLLGSFDAGEVELIGEGEAIALLEAELHAHGARMAQPDPPAVRDDPPDRAPARPTLARQQRTRPRAVAVLVWGVVGAVAVLAAVLSWRWLAADPQAAQPAASEAPEEPSAARSEPEAPTRSAVLPPPVPAPRTMSLQGLEVRLPVDFGLSERPDGEVQASGEDPNLRILLAAEPADARSVEGTLTAIEHDPSLELLHAPSAQEERPTVVYLERAEDGSQVRWTQWHEGGHTLFVGCQTRAVPTSTQLAHCDQAVATLRPLDGFIAS